MSNPRDLRELLTELADNARDVPDMPVTRAVVPPRQRRVRLVLLTTAVLAAVVLSVAALNGIRLGPVPALPASGPTVAVPSPSSPTIPGGSTPTPAVPTTASGSELPTRPMTESEISTRTAACIQGALKTHRKGELTVLYAVIQASVGYPIDGKPQGVLLLADDGGYFDCSDGRSNSWEDQAVDEVTAGPSAVGVELQALSGGSSSFCPAPDDLTSAVESAVVLRTSADARTARVTVHARGGTRTATVPASRGYVYVTTRVSGKAAWKPVRITLELLDSAGMRLPVKPYGESVTDQLTYSLDVCTSDPQR